MKLKISIKYIIALISLSSIIGAVAIFACAGGEPDDIDVTSFFSPEVIKAKQFKPFFRSIHTYYNSDYRSDNISDFNQVNIEEWYMFFAKFASKKDLEFLLYHSRTGEVDSLSKFVANSKLNIAPNLKKNSILIIANKPLLKEFLDYAVFAKKCEPYATYNPYWYWNDDSKYNPKKNGSALSMLIGEGYKAKSASKSQYIQQRYNFQIQRLFFMKADYNASYNYYYTNEESYSANSTIKYRAMSYAAGALRRLKKVSEANYLYSKAYDKCDLLKIPVRESFSFQEETDWQNCLALAKTNHERAVLWHIFGISYDAIKAMKEIYTLEPNSELLESLLVRSINIEEEHVLPQYAYWSNHSDGYKINSAKLNKDLFEFVKQVAQENNTNSPYLWNLAAGYLSILSKDYITGADYLAKVDGNDDKLLTEQIKLISIVSKVIQYEKYNENIEADLVKGLTWIKSRDHELGLRNYQTYSWVKRNLAEKYAAWGDALKAQCLNSEIDVNYYKDNSKINKLLAYYNKPNKTDFDVFVLSEHPYTKADLIELQAVQLVYDGKYREALAKFKEDEVAGNSELLANPFNAQINDCHDCDHSINQKMTKQHAIENLIQYEEKVKTDPGNAGKYYYYIANCLYNMSYFGNARLMYQTKIREYSVFAFEYEKVTDNAFIFDNEKAEEYYIKAMKVSTNKEFKAKCCFMAAKCEQNYFFMHKPQDYKGDFKSGEYFRMLKENYSSTDLYKDLIRECSYFEKYAN